ncbi:MAG: peroxiredoxin [Polyangiaceae bacterium]|nr:peroxiredoxin [Polyangiaceae bacterium]
MKQLPLYVVALAIAAAGCSSSEPSGKSSASPSGSAAAQATLKVGDAAPSVTLKLHDGRSIDLASLKGKFVLVYFYPKDDTPGCTIEARGIKEEWEKFQAAGIEVFGVSTQDAASHQSFIDKYELPFPLVTDGVEVAEAFGVPMKNGLTERQSFLIGKDGKVIAVWTKVDPSQHADEVLSAAS